jgi:hypothetical protein
MTSDTAWAGSRRSGDEIHPWLPNGDLRPVAAVRTQFIKRRFCRGNGHIEVLGNGIKSVMKLVFLLVSLTTLREEATRC